MISQLKMMDLDDLADAYKDLLSDSKKEEIHNEIPLFSNIVDSPENEFSELFQECVGDYIREEFKKRMITKDEILQIQDDISVDRVKTILGYQKTLFLKQRLIDKFTKASTGLLDRKVFCFFLDQLSLIQNAILDFLSIDPFITTTITEDTLMSFIEKRIAKSSSLKVLTMQNQWFQEYYIEYLIHVFEFYFGSFSNPENMDAVRMLGSRIFLDFISLDKYICSTPNMFKISEVTTVYNLFADNMNKDNDGMKGKENMKKLSKSLFTDAFLERLFDVLPTIDGKIDFLLFIDFYIAYQNMYTKRGISYFFKILDIDEDGLLKKNDILYFYKALIEETKFENSNEDRYFSELVDTVGGDFNKGISEEDLHKLGSTTFIKKLIDINCFKEWECIDQ